jgi:GNAT superfamily N-acetyltransferase
MNVVSIPGLEHEPFAEVWFHELDEARLATASQEARSIGKPGLEVWTTTRTPDVVAFLEQRGYEEVRRYVISELDVVSAPAPGPPGYTLVTFAERPELADRLYELALVAYPDQPGRSGTRIDSAWYEWGLRAHPADSYFVALADERVLGYGYLELDGGQWRNGFMAVARDARGRGVAGAIKRAQIAWAKKRGIETLRTANEVRLESMLALNRRLGYHPLYDEIVLRGPVA